MADETLNPQVNLAEIKSALIKWYDAAVKNSPHHKLDTDAINAATKPMPNDTAYRRLDIVLPNGVWLPVVINNEHISSKTDLLKKSQNVEWCFNLKDKNSTNSNLVPASEIIVEKGLAFDRVRNEVKTKVTEASLSKTKQWEILGKTAALLDKYESKGNNGISANGMLIISKTIDEEIAHAKNGPKSHENKTKEQIHPAKGDSIISEIVEILKPGDLPKYTKAIAAERFPS